MAIYKNKASQKLAVFAVDSAGAPKTGDAANITAQISKDGAAVAATNDTNPTELDATNAKGLYLFDLTQAETNADLMVVSPVSATAGVVLRPVIAYTEPELRSLDAAYDAAKTAATQASVNALQESVNGIGTAGGASINTDVSTDNASAGIPGVTSGTTRVGTATNTYTATTALNGVFHVITHSGQVVDVVYQFLGGGGTSPVSIVWTGLLNILTSVGTMSLWNHVGGAWEPMATIAGQTSTTATVVKNIPLYARHMGTSAAELGKVYLRINVPNSPAVNHVLRTDQVYMTYTVTSRSVGYANGAIWLDTVNGTAGTETFVNGTADKPVNTLAHAATIASAIGIKNIQVSNGSAVTFVGSMANYSLLGDGFDVHFGGQNVSDLVLVGAHIDGVGIGADMDAHYGTAGNATIPVGTHYHFMALYGTTTLGAVGNYTLDGCYSVIAGDAADTMPVIDFAGWGASTVNIRHYSGGLKLMNMGAGDICSIDGCGSIVVDSTCTNGALTVHGNFDIIDNSNEGVAITSTAVTPTAAANATAVWGAGTKAVTSVANAVTITSNADITAILADTAAIEPVTTKLDGMLVVDGGVSQYTANALELAPSGGSGTAPTVQQIDTQLSSTHGAGSWLSSAGGSGSSTLTYTLTSTVGATPINGATVEVYTEAGMSNLVAQGTTNAFGVVTFALDPGTYYLKRIKVGWDFANPDTEVVS